MTKRERDPPNKSGETLRARACALDHQRIFSIPRIQSDLAVKSTEFVWLVNEVGMLISKLNDLIIQLSSIINGQSMDQGVTMVP